MAYAYMHVHSMYSLHDSPAAPEDIVKNAKENGIHSVTLTDHGTLLGINAFMDAGKKYGVNTVPGIELYTEDRRHLIVLAKDYEGYQAISYALRDSWVHYQKKAKLFYPITNREILEKYFKDNTHVIATSACIASSINRILLTNHTLIDEINKYKKNMAKLEDPYHAYIEAQKQYSEFSDKLSSLKKELKSYNSELKKKTAKKEKNPGQISFFDDSESIMQELKKATETISLEIKYTENMKKDAKKRMDLFKSKHDTYLNTDKKIKDINLYPDEVLYESAYKELNYLKSVFPNFYIELQYHGIDKEAYVMPLLEKLAIETNTPVIAGLDAHMIGNTDNDIRARQILRFNYFEKASPVMDADKELYLKSESELLKVLTQVVSDCTARMAIENTGILDTCHVVFPCEEHYPKVKNAEEIFDSLLYDARKKMIANHKWNDQYEKRLAHETAIIKQMGYVDYHLIVRDFCNEARLLGSVPKDQLDQIPNDFSLVEQWVHDHGFNIGVGVGPGRGSAGGSLVCYLLGITNIDPTRYNLLFERFLNPERISMPDIDTDIKKSLRPVIIKYIKWKYGEKAVCSIDTENKYAAKESINMSIRNRASELYDTAIPKKAERDEKKKDYRDKLSGIAKLISEDPKESLALHEKEFRSKFGHNEEACIIWNDAKLIEGKLFTTGVHAGGIIISDNDNVNDYIPLQYVENKNVWAAQCNMEQAEKRGLLKMDILGLNTLDIISDCLHLIYKHHGVAVDIENIPFEKEVFANIYSKGLTTSVFQFESPGMKQMLCQFKPENIEDIILLNACFRPGPLKYLQDIINVKNTGKQKKSCLTEIPELADILKDTYGFPIYQEQVMQIFQKLAGYTLGGADMVRRYMSKKKEDKLEEERTIFLYGSAERNVPGCKNNGIDINLANELFDQLMDFARYGFNKSHSCAYSIVSYQTAWLKYHYPAEFMCSVFENKTQDTYKLLIEDCKTFHVEILPPDINRSFFNFVIEDGKIRYGFKGVKGIASPDAVKAIIDQRENPFTSFSDFLIRMKTAPEKSTIKTLILSGFFNRFIKNRQKALEFYEHIPDYPGDDDALLKMERSYDRYPENISDAILYDIGYLGDCINFDPLKEYSCDEEYKCQPMDDLKTGYGTVFGYVISCEAKTSKKGTRMYVIQLQGKRGKIRLYITNTRFMDVENFYGKIIKAAGKIDAERNSMLVSSYTFNFMPTKKKCSIVIDSPESYQEYMRIYNEDKGIKSYELYILTNLKFDKKSNRIIRSNQRYVAKADVSESLVSELSQWDSFEKE